MIVGELSTICSLACQVYAVALYVEAERAAKELGVRKRGGFFDDDRQGPLRVLLAVDAHAGPAHQTCRWLCSMSAMTCATNEPSRQAGCTTSRNEDFALALVDGAFTKALEVHLVRKVPATPSAPGAALRVLAQTGFMSSCA